MERAADPGEYYRDVLIPLKFELCSATAAKETPDGFAHSDGDALGGGGARGREPLAEPKRPRLRGGGGVSRGGVLEETAST